MSTYTREERRVGLFDLDESYALGKKIEIFNKKSNSLRLLTVCNIMLVRFVRNTHWVTEWLIHLK